MRQVIGGVELVAPGRLGAFNAAVEVWPLRRQDKEFEAALFAFVLENRIELAAAIDLNAANGERRLSSSDLALAALAAMETRSMVQLAIGS